MQSGFSNRSLGWGTTPILNRVPTPRRMPALQEQVEENLGTLAVASDLGKRALDPPFLVIKGVLTCHVRRLVE